jgi:hypothetical protein
MPWSKLGGGAVPEGYELTCEETCRAKVDAFNVITLAPRAIISVGSSLYVPLAARDKFVPAHEVQLREGKIDALSPNAYAMPLAISALGSTHVALRAAGAQVAVKDDHAAVQVTSGTARAGANRKWITLETGQMSTLPAQGSPSEPAPAIAAPEWTGGSDCNPGLALVRGDAPVVVGGCWKQVPRAASYVVEVSRDPSFATIDSEEPSNVPSWSKPLASGRSFVRVRAVDDDGLVGATSATRTIARIGVNVPLGSTIDASQRTFTLPQGRSLELADPAGLEVAFDSAVFSPAQRFIIMDGVPSHVLRVRFKDDPRSEGTAVLQRRALAADVAFSPKLARWPQDPIDLTVTLSNASGVVDTSRVSPKMHVLVGLTEVPVEWSQSGRAWAARLAPRNVAPTVVRVIVEDEFGTPIGRNFVEVDQGRTGPGYVVSK